MTRRSLTALLILAGAGLTAFLWWPDDERAIRGRLDELAEQLSLEGSGDGMGMVAQVASLRGFLAPDVRIVVGSQEIVTREALLGLLSRNVAQADRTVEFVDVTVTVAPDGASAHVYMTATLSMQPSRADETTFDAREVDLEMTKLEGMWVVARAAARETIRSP